MKEALKKKNNKILETELKTDQNLPTNYIIIFWYLIVIKGQHFDKTKKSQFMTFQSNHILVLNLINILLGKYCTNVAFALVKD